MFLFLNLIQPIAAQEVELEEPNVEITILVNEPVNDEANAISMMGTTDSKSVVIDPGHGEEGSPGYEGYLEYEAMWKLANHLKDALTESGATVNLTKDTEEANPSLGERGQKAKGKNLFISLHSNAYPGDESINGCEAWYSVDQSWNEDHAKALAQKGSEIMGNSNRGAKKSGIGGDNDFAVIRNAVEAGCPYVFLVESGFHTNAEDREFLQDNEKLKELAKGYAKVICGIFENAHTDVEEMIKNLPAPDDVTLEHKAQVEAARAAYDALTDEQKTFVGEEHVEKLKALEERIAELEEEPIEPEEPGEEEPIEPEEPGEQEPTEPEEPGEQEPTEPEEPREEINEVEEMIDNLPAPDDVRLADKDAVEAARAAYNALTDDQKALVGEEYVEKLEALEEKIAELEDKAAAEAVIDQIVALPEVDELTLEDKAQVEAARLAYDALTDDQKALVTNLDELEALEEKIAELEGEPEEEPGEQEPTEPTKPAEPTEPTEPAEPTEPTEPAKPVEPTEPAEPTKPIEPTEPTKPAEPTEPTEPTTEEKPITATSNYNFLVIGIAMIIIGAIMIAIMRRKQENTM